MITLNEIRKIAERMFPATPLSLAHLLVAWASEDPEGEMKDFLAGSGIEPASFAGHLSGFLHVTATEDKELLISCIRSVSGEEVKASHLLRGLCALPTHRLTKALTAAGMDCRAVLRNMQRLEDAKTSLSMLGIRVEQKAGSLLRFGRDLTALAADGAFSELSPLPEEIHRLTDVLLRKRKGNPVLTGPAGVGKTALVELLALEIVNNEESPFSKYRIFEVSMGKLVAGTKYRGDFEARFEEAMQAVIESAPAILFIDEIHLLVGAGRADGVVMDGANLIKPFLARDDFRVIGATTSSEYYRHIARDEALARRFQQIPLKEPTPDILLSMALRQAQVLAGHHGVEIDKRAVEKAIEITDRHLPARHQPDKTIDLLDSTAVAVRRKGGDKVQDDDLLETLARLTGIPLGALTQDGRASLSHLAQSLKRRVIGQDQAIDKVVGALIHRRMDIGREERPLGVFLFAGDTGVGKTELACSLASSFLGDERKLLQLDLAECAGPGGIHKLIGAPAGYRDSEEEGHLIRGLQKHSSCVILFDEIEKASSEVHNLLLGLLDNGRITSSQGAQMDARQCVIIMTTNALTSKDLGRQPLGFGNSAVIGPDPFEILGRSFSREFLSRFDDIIPFRSLAREDLTEIMKLRVREAMERLCAKGIRLVFENGRLMDYLMERFDRERIDARGIARLLERKLLQPLAIALLQSGEGKEVVVELGEMFYEKGIVTICQSGLQKSG
jgi:ATP-dependent Clp protease ATP-binding subunit ClpC